ncbi:MAG: 4a-hydroxytetrahydrobiopterin dehydratase [Acidimicrobiales bacterium]
MATLLDDNAIASALVSLNWERFGDELVKVHEAKGFKEALDWVVQVGGLAEEANHHPDIDVRWSTVTLRLSTHSAGGITSADMDLASRIDALTAG